MKKGLSIGDEDYAIGKYMGCPEPDPLNPPSKTLITSWGKYSK